MNSRLKKLEEALDRFAASRPYLHHPRHHVNERFEFLVEFNYRRRSREIAEWCQANGEGNYSLDGKGVSFELKKDALLFKLTWVGV